MTADTPAPSDGPLVAELSEDALLARIFPLLPLGADTHVPPGDDAAVVAAPDGRFVVTTDVLVEDRHFRRAWSSGEDVGRRAAVQNLADVAAMGARPTSLVVALVIPGDLPVSWVEGLARGLAAECAPLGVGVVGGDLSGGPVVVVAVTAHGDLAGLAPVLRSGARPGDVVAHAGVAGWSAAGLALLDAGRPELDAVLVDAHRRPVAPLAAGPVAARAGATAMLDVSDGLLRDAGRIARASGVRIDLDGGRVRRGPGPAAHRRGRARRRGGALGPGRWGGPRPAGDVPGRRRRCRRRSGPSVASREGAGVSVDGVPAPARSGWDHFAG